jgi:hypothetical protein
MVHGAYTLIPHGSPVRNITSRRERQLATHIGADHGTGTMPVMRRRSVRLELEVG